MSKDERLFAELTSNSLLRRFWVFLWKPFFLRSTPSVTWLGSDAASQGALDKMSHLMRCQTKTDLLDNKVGHCRHAPKRFKDRLPQSIRFGGGRERKKEKNKHK